MEPKTILQMIESDLENLSNHVSKVCREGNSCKTCLLHWRKEQDRDICILDDLNYLDCLGKIRYKLRKLEEKKNV